MPAIFLVAADSTCFWEDGMRGSTGIKNALSAHNGFLLRNTDYYRESGDGMECHPEAERKFEYNPHHS